MCVVLNLRSQLIRLTPGKQQYTVVLQLLIVVLYPLKQETHTRSKIQPPVDELPTQNVCCWGLVREASSGTD